MVVGLLALIAGLLGGTVPAAMAAPTGNVVVDPTFAPVGAAGGRVYTSTAQPDGKVLIGGWFAIVGGAPRSNVARLNADGAPDAAFSADVDGPVFAIAVQEDGKVVIGGSFTRVNGAARGGVARLNSNGTLDAGFDPGAGVTTNPSHAVRALALQPDGAVVIGGQFDQVNGLARGNFARLTATGAVDGTFAGGGGFNSPVFALLRQSDGAIVVGGVFTNYSGLPRNSIARVLPNGFLDGSFSPGTGLQTMSSGAGLMPGQALALTRQSDGKLLVGGRFNRVNGFEMRSLTRLNTNGTRDATFVTGSGFQPDPITPMLDVGTVSAVHLGAGGTILAGGDFGMFNGTPRGRLARLAATGDLDAAFNPGTGIQGAHFNTGVDTLTGQAGGQVIVGGLFTNYNGASSNAIVRVNPSGAADVGFQPGVGSGSGFNDSVAAVAVQPDGKTIAGGWFGSFNGTARIGVARLNANGTLDPGFTPALTPGVSLVNAVALQPDGKVLIGGGFTAVNGVARPQIARLNADGTLDASFNPGTGFNGAQRGVLALLVQPDGKVVVGGDFTTFNGVARSRIARLNANGTLDNSFNPGAGFGGSSGNEVFSLAQQPDGKIIAAGSFDTYGGSWLTPGVARINPDGSLDTSVSGSGNRPFFAVSLGPDGNFVVGGRTLMRFRAAGGWDAGFAPPTFEGVQGSPAYVRAVQVLSDNSILVGGDFVSIGGVPRKGIARLLPSGALDPAFDPGSGFTARIMSAIPGVASMAPMADGRIVVGGGFEGFNDGFPPPANITRLQPTVVPPGAPTGLSVTNGDGAALVSFTAPASHGGAPVTNYEYSVDGGGWTARVPASAVPAVTVLGLANGVAVSVRVRAVNAAGSGAPSDPVTVKPVAAAASTFVPITPARVVDSRVAFGGAGPLAPGETRTLSVVAPPGGAPVVPAGMVAVAYNLTVPSPGAGGHVRVMPGDAVGLPGASAINFLAGETIANAATVKIDAAGQVKVYNGAGGLVDVVIDVTGFFVPQKAGAAASALGAAGSAPGVGGSGGFTPPPPVGTGRLFTPISPVRVYDTVLDPEGSLPGGGTRLVSARTAADGVTPVVPAGAWAVAYNVTVTDTVGSGHLRVFPAGAPLTATSVLNWSRSGERIANASVVGVDDRGRISVYNGSSAPVRFLVDVVGYYSDTGREFYPIDPVRTTETRDAMGGAGPIAPVAAGQRSVTTATSAVGGLPVVPAGATAAAYNATVVATGSPGHLRVYPTGAPLVGASALNWPGVGYTRANASIVAVPGNREVTLYNGASTPTDVLIDVNGYYK